MAITIDHQDITQHCEHCNKPFEVSRGSIYDDKTGFSIYIAGMHKCEPGELVHLVIAIQKGYEGIAETCAIALYIWRTELEFQMSVIDAKLSPWQHETYLGRILGMKRLVFHK